MYTMAFGLCCIFQGFNNEQLKYILIEQVTLLKLLVSTFSTCTALSQWSGDETLPATNFSTPLMPGTTLGWSLGLSALLSFLGVLYPAQGFSLSFDTCCGKLGVALGKALPLNCTQPPGHCRPLT